MLDRRYLKGSLLLGLALSLCGCSSPSLVGIRISPSATFFGGPGATEQLTATGVYSQGNHPATTQDITSQVKWSVASVDVAVVNSNGVITSTNIQGSTVVYATMNGFTGLVTGTAQITDCNGLTSGSTGCK